MISFGAGSLFVKEGSGTNPKTIKAMTLKGATLDISEEFVKLYGAHKYPKDVANGQGSMTGKITVGEINLDLFAAVLSGSTSATGYEELITDPDTAIPTTPFQITVTGLKEDYGVEFTDGTPLIRVASAPAAGQFSVNEATGAYTFASADNVSGKKVRISYTKDVAASGSTLTYANQLMGAGSTWKLRLWNSYGGKKIGFYLPAVKIGKGGLGFQSDAHSSQEYDFEAFESSDGTIFRLFRS